MQQFAQYGNKMEDIKARIDENEMNIQQIHISSQRKINQVQEDFNTLKSDFRREEEFSRIARKSADVLQEEYCKLTSSVAKEKQRNLAMIERAKREFVTELTAMNVKVGNIDLLQKKVTEINTRVIEKEKVMMVDVETVLLK